MKPNRLPNYSKRMHPSSRRISKSHFALCIYTQDSAFVCQHPKHTVHNHHPIFKKEQIRISVFSYWREGSWTDSEESKSASKEEANPSNIFGMFPAPQARPRAKWGPIIPMDTEELEHPCLFWKNCFIAILMNIRRFFVRTVQQIINRAWRLRDRVIVVGRANNNYVIQFNNVHDLNFMWQHGPWSLDGALMAMDIWRPNLILSEVYLPLIPIWVQLWELPLKYQNPTIARRFA